MQIRPSMTMVPLLATILVSPVVQAIGEPSSDARMDRVVLPAPVGHRQPTLDDLPPWLREIEKPGLRQAQHKTQNSDERRVDRPMTAFLEFANHADIVLARGSVNGERCVPRLRRPYARVQRRCLARGRRGDSLRPMSRGESRHQ